MAGSELSGSGGSTGHTGPSFPVSGISSGRAAASVGGWQRCKRLCASLALEEKAECKLHSSGNVPELNKVGFPDGCKAMELI